MKDFPNRPLDSYVGLLICCAVDPTSVQSLLAHSGLRLRLSSDGRASRTRCNSAVSLSLPRPNLPLRSRYFEAPSDLKIVLASRGMFQFLERFSWVADSIFFVVSLLHSTLPSGKRRCEHCLTTENCRIIAWLSLGSFPPSPSRIIIERLIPASFNFPNAF